MSNKDAYAQLRELGLLEYGSHIKAELFRELFGIKEVEYPAMRREIQEQELQELSAADYVRNKLLNEGKYLKGTKDGYRILLPSENAAQVLSYMASADRKLKRGLKLNNNTPETFRIDHQDEVRAIMKRESIKGN